MVRDNRTNGFVPSCTALAQDGMDIDVSGEEVVAIRNKAIELLLSEHRAECEAPCRIVCPAGYNIPEMNRLLSAGDYRKAVELSVSELDAPEIRCHTCPGYCENACRRKKVDKQISIKNIQIFVSAKIKDEIDNISTIPLSEYPDLKKRFSSRVGKLEDGELQEWLKECTEKRNRFETIEEFASAGDEASSCMHCDCRASNDCRLRDISQEFSIRDKGKKVVNAPIQKKINHKTGLVFENAKCIKCGLCVRVCEDSKEEPALCFINRGFISIISEPLTAGFEDILATKSGIVIDVCPTGALEWFKTDKK
jgi:predicted molibdopterin-dependent oxidoreductase YjgC